MITFKHRGNFNKTRIFFVRMIKAKYLSVLEKYGQLGVEALAAATPIDSGLTAASWSFEIEYGVDSTTIKWANSNVVGGWANVAILLQYGHGTGTGGYVEGIDYINPALKPIFDKLAEDVWMEVTGS
jgi:hypothetical protein